VPTYMDRHDGVTVTPEELAGAHAMDVAVQAKHGVNYLSYWYDRDSECVFCFVEAPNKAAAEAVHKEAHGLTATKIIEVEGHTVMGFLGGLPTRPVGEAHEESAFRTILFTDIVGSTDMTQRLGDAKAMELLRIHDLIVRGHLGKAGGSEVKHTGDGIMASFPSVARAIQCAIAIQTDLETHNQSADHPITVRIGVSAGEPVAERDDLFGAAVQLAARACNHAAAGSILVSNAVRELCLGKGFAFVARGPFELKGFDEKIPLYEVAWRTTS
jgi:class 3 adenylate cyclase